MCIELKITSKPIIYDILRLIVQKNAKIQKNIRRKSNEKKIFKISL